MVVGATVVTGAVSLVDYSSQSRSPERTSVSVITLVEARPEGEGEGSPVLTLELARGRCSSQVPEGEWCPLARHCLIWTAYP